MDRVDAGRSLGEHLAAKRTGDAVVLGLPRGGVIVAAEVARALRAPLDVIVVRKLGVPWARERAMGAIGEDGVRVINDDVVRRSGVSGRDLAEVERVEQAELRRRVQRLRGIRPRLSVSGRVVIVVDDGIATGATARAACQVARAHGAAMVIVAVPVGASSAVEDLREVADTVVCLRDLGSLGAIGAAYDDFDQVSDARVLKVLHAARTATAASAPMAAVPVGIDAEVLVSAGPLRLPGHLRAPAEAVGAVVFAHGSGSSRHSPRNRYVADALAAAGLGSLLFDLLTDVEAEDRHSVFDIELLAGRLGRAVEWLRSRDELSGRAIGLFGASTGAAAALWAAAEPDADIAAVVSRGGRPDLAGDRLADVRTPTLLIVGGLDRDVIGLNEMALGRLACEKRLAIVPGAGHLFAEPSTLAQAAGLAAAWFTDHLRPKV